VAKIRIGDILLAAGLIDDLQLQAALAHQRQWGGRLGDALIGMGFLDEVLLWQGLSKQLAIPLFDLASQRIDPGVVASLPATLCEKYAIVPVARDDRVLTVATSDPNNIAGIDEVAFRTGLRVRVVLTSDREIAWAIRHYLYGDMGRCPPPRMKSEHAQGGLATDGWESLTTETQPPTSSMPSQPPSVSPDVSLRQTAQMLRALVDGCIARGIFSRQEFLEKLRRMP
jgi:type IV pilus assembly protein PilB